MILKYIWILMVFQGPQEPCHRHLLRCQSLLILLNHYSFWPCQSPFLPNISKANQGNKAKNLTNSLPFHRISNTILYVSQNHSAFWKLIVGISVSVRFRKFIAILDYPIFYSVLWRSILTGCVAIFFFINESGNTCIFYQPVLGRVQDTRIRTVLTHWGWATHICVCKLTIIGSDNGRRQAWTAQSHFLNQCWNIVDLNLRNKLQWNLKRNSYISIQENSFENVVCEMAVILSRPQ